MSAEIERLTTLGKEIHTLVHTAAVLGWDQHTYMPEQGTRERAKQISLLEGMIHEKITAPEISALLSDVEAVPENPKGNASLPEPDRAYLRHVHRLHHRAKKLSRDLVEKLAEETCNGQAVWVEARKKNDFHLFQPHLERILKLTREKADMLGYEEHPYDALLDEFEPWVRTSQVERVFKEVKDGLVPIISAVAETEQVDDSMLYRSYPKDKQEAFGRKVLEDIGYDFSRGRLDVSAHPFTITLGADDVRITTRYNEGFFNTSIFGTIHECGHGLYELGFSDEIRGNLLADGTSLGIHESQSRTWENLIGRSRPFWNHYFPELRKLFPENLEGVSEEAFYKAINKVTPSLIRVEADEVTYNLHIILRFELETALVTGSLAVEDLPGAWNDKFNEMFGISPGSDADGVLQDVHWSAGLMGYFPTYALGNLYGSQFFNVLRKDIPGVDDQIRSGNFSEILSWLQSRIHHHGSAYTADELCNEITGESLNPRYFLDYIEKKFSQIYDL